MTMTDPIADMLTRIRNALKASHESVDIPSSKLKINIAKVLKSEGYIRNFKMISDGKQGLIKIFLKYDDRGAAVIGGLERVSKPSRRVYSSFDEIPKVLGGYGVQNPIDFMAPFNRVSRAARESRVGGEILFSVW